MSIRTKFFIIMLLAFGLNIAMLLGYYKFVVAGEISDYYSLAQDELHEQVTLIAGQLNGKGDIFDELEAIARENDYILRLEDGSGNTVFETAGADGGDIHISSSGMINADGGVFLITIMRALPIDRLPMMWFMHKLLYAEAFIVIFILLLLTAVIYWNFIRTILGIQNDMERYKKGIKPQRTRRLDEIGLLKNRFAELTDAIDTEKQKQNNIIAAISHDIKTPLTSVMGYAEQLNKNVLPHERQQKYLEIIYAKSLSIGDIINEFDEYLDYNLQSAMKKSKTTAGRLVDLIREEYDFELSGMGVGFSAECECPGSAISADISKIRRVFGNIIGNSLKHSGNLKPELSIRCAEQGENILFSVSDNGAGVPEENLEKIFDPLFTSDLGRKISGLGLSICKSIVEAHDGKIWAENKAEGGLVIFFTLPGK